MGSTKTVYVAGFGFYDNIAVHSFHAVGFRESKWFLRGTGTLM
jgi:hypothetical protein